MMSQGRLVGSLILATTFTLFLSACGSAHQGWASFPVPIYTDPSISQNAQAQADLQDAFNFWENKVGGKKLFQYAGQWNGGTEYSGDPTSPSTINGNVLFFQNPWPFPPVTVGMTTVKSDDSGIESAMIMINPNTSFCGGDCDNDYRTSERKTFTHELGHFIGLSHVTDQTNIMYPTSLPGGSLDNMTVDETALSLFTQAAK